MQQVESIVTQAAEVFHHTKDELVGRSRKRSIVEARHAAMWAVRQRYPSFSLELIGAAIGGRHYSTVMHALAVVEARAADNQIYQEQLSDLLDRVTSRSQPLRATLIEQAGIPQLRRISLPNTLPKRHSDLALLQQ